MKKYLLSIITLFVVLLVQAQTIPQLKGVRQYYYHKGVKKSLNLTYNRESQTGYSHADYYISATGNDNANGKTPATAWQTVDKVNTEIAKGTFIAGDTIAFKKNDTFNGYLSFSNIHGTISNPIVIGSYGSGNKPIIKNSYTITGSWTNEGNNIYSHSAPTYSDLWFLQINSKNKIVGREPDNDSLWYTSTISYTAPYDSIADNTRLQADDYWNGADVWVRCEDWTSNRTHVSDYIGATGVFLLSPNLANGFYPNTANHYYLICNHRNCLDHQGEWSYDRTNHIIYIYSTTTLNDSIVEIPNTQNIISVSNGSSYLTFDGLDIKLSNANGIDVNASSNIIVKNSNISYCLSGVYFTAGSSYSEVSHSNISYCLSEGIRTGRSNVMRFHDNYINNINTHPGQYSMSATGRGIAVVSEFTTFDEGCDSTFIYRNRIDKTGSAGIVFTRSNATYVDSNYVSDATWLLSDYGGIYHVTNSDFYWHGDTWNKNFIRNNFVDMRNVYTNGNGKNRPSDTYQAIYGIYGDNYTENTYIENNLILGGRAGLFLHLNDTITVKNNIALNTNRIAFYISGRGRNFKVQDNIWISPYLGGTTSIFPMYSLSSTLDGTIFDRNHYLLPNDNYESTYFIHLDTYDDYNNISTWRATTWASDNEYTDEIDYSETGLSTIDSMYHWYYNWSSNPVYLSNIKTPGYSYYNVMGDIVTVDTILPYRGKVWIRSRAGSNNVPIASNVTSTGTLKVGQTLTASYTYSDTENDPQSGTSFRWMRANDINGSGSIVINGATASSYLLVAADSLHYIAPEVTPRASSGSSPGNAVIGIYRGEVRDSSVSLGSNLLSGYDLTDATWTEVNCTPTGIHDISISSTSGGTRKTILTPGVSYRLIGNWIENSGIDVRIAVSYTDGSNRTYILDSPGTVEFTAGASVTNIYIRYTDGDGTGTATITQLELYQL